MWSTEKPCELSIERTVHLCKDGVHTRVESPSDIRQSVALCRRDFNQSGWLVEEHSDDIAVFNVF